MKLDTEAEVRDFLRLCLNSPKRPRTIAKLAEIMPTWLSDQLDVHAPHLPVLRAEVARLEAETARARRTYEKALGAWIAAEPQADGSQP